MSFEKEQDYCGYDEFVQFRDVQLTLPSNLVEMIEEYASKNPKGGINGAYAFLLWKGLESADIK